MFGEGIGFNIGEGKTTHHTYLGSLLKLVVIVITLTYTFKRYEVMSQYADTVFQTSKEPNPDTRASPLRQDESNFNLMLNLVLYSPDGSIVLLGNSGGYLELNFYQQTYSSNSDGFQVD